MARYLGPRLKVSRREGTDLGFFSGIRSLDDKFSAKKDPSKASLKKPRMSEYGEQLREKQKLKRTYGILEKQFRSYFKKASKSKGNTGITILLLLEKRLDNIVYRLGFSSTRAEARQLVNHGSILVNGKKIDIPSFQVSVGDIIEVSKKSSNQIRVRAAMEISDSRRAQSAWLEVSESELKGIFKQLPERSEYAHDINEQLIVELYSR